MSQIIVPGQAAQTPEVADENNIGEELNIHVVTRIAGALDQLQQLEAQSVVTPTSEAQKRALRAFLTKSFLAHGSELLGAYFSLKGEYEPLIGTLAILFRRVTGTIDTMRRQENAARLRAQAEAKAAEAPAQAEQSPTPAPNC